jgi:hypothetical protein
LADSELPDGLAPSPFEPPLLPLPDCVPNGLFGEGGLLALLPAYEIWAGGSLRIRAARGRRIEGVAATASLGEQLRGSVGHLGLVLTTSRSAGQ